MSKEIDFEAAFAELEALVEKMESGNLSLEESLVAYERGVTLGRKCQEALTAAELRIRELSGGEPAEPQAPTPESGADGEDDIPF